MRKTASTCAFSHFWAASKLSTYWYLFTAFVFGLPRFDNEGRRVGPDLQDEGRDEPLFHRKRQQEERRTYDPSFFPLFDNMLTNAPHTACADFLFSLWELATYTYKDGKLLTLIFTDFSG